MLYKNIELNCTQAELDTYIASILVTSDIRNFTQKYNNVQIENPMGQADAKYYVLSINGSDIIQTHDSSKQGFVAITDLNATEIIEKHKQEIIDNMIFSKFSVVEEDKVTKLEKELSGLQSAMAEISMMLMTP